MNGSHSSMEEIFRAEVEQLRTQVRQLTEENERLRKNGHHFCVQCCKARAEKQRESYARLRAEDTDRRKDLNCALACFSLGFGLTLLLLHCMGAF